MGTFMSSYSYMTMMTHLSVQCAFHCFGNTELQQCTSIVWSHIETPYRKDRVIVSIAMKYLKNDLVKKSGHHRGALMHTAFRLGYYKYVANVQHISYMYI